MVVKDKAAWKNWVTSKSAEIRELAAEGFENSLLNKIRGVYRLSTGRVVPSAFQAYNTILTPEMIAELEARDIMVHQGTMAPDGYDADRDFRRVAVVRTMLVALIARSVDYAGAINGWTVGQLGHPLEPHGWWSVSEEDRQLALRTFSAEEVETE